MPQRQDLNLDMSRSVKDKCKISYGLMRGQQYTKEILGSLEVRDAQSDPRTTRAPVTIRSVLEINKVARLGLKLWVCCLYHAQSTEKNKCPWE